MATARICATSAARHHRPGGRARPRRRGLRRARRRPDEPGRLRRHRRHRRRRRTTCGPARALDREALRARQLGLFPRPRRADAAGAHLQRSLLAARRRGPRLPRRAHGLRRRGPQDAATASIACMMRSAAKLSYEQAQAAIDGSPTTRPARCSSPILKPLWAAYAALADGARRGASRSSSTCPSARSSSTTTAGRPHRRAASASTRTG